MHETISLSSHQSNEDFLTHCYLTYFSREIDPQGKNYYLRRLHAGHNKIDILYDLSRSPEFIASHTERRALRRLFLKNGNIGIWGLRSARRALFTLGQIAASQQQLALMLSPSLKHGAPPTIDEVGTAEAGIQHEPLSRSLSTQIPATACNYDSRTPADHFTQLTGDPLVSILIVNYNGAIHIPTLATALAQQTYQNYEVIFVDNNSSDDSVAIARRLLKQPDIIEANVNLGFAEGNNLAQERARGDLILLLNNDTRPEPSFLAELVSSFLDPKNEKIAVSVPKIRFFEPFVTIEVRAPCRFTLDASNLLAQCGHYKKLIERTRLSEANTTHIFLIPTSAKPLKLLMTFEKDYQPTPEDADSISLQINGSSSQKFRAEIVRDKVVVAIHETITGGIPVINNVGSYIHPNGDCGDIGIYENDNGQYDAPREVDALCGCAALIRRESLGNFPLFASDFFAYYEDTELSIRLRSGGWKIFYNPLAVINHKHAATSNDKSSTFRYLVARNRLLLLAIHFKPLLPSHLSEALATWNHFISVNSPEVFPEPEQREFVDRLPALLEELPAFLSRIQHGIFFERKNKFFRVGIYNEYWDTHGGGELRALRLADELSKYCIVDLICNKPFDIDGLRQYFGMQLTRMRRMVVLGFSAEDTRGYDLFINSTHHSNLVSQAQTSWYLLSFPHPHVTPGVLSSYDLILANSRFSQDWVKRYWGNHTPVTVLYPPVDMPFDSLNSFHLANNSDRKQRIILSIGRFFIRGHCKRQMEMVDAFKELTKNQQHSDWRLVLVGSLNEADSESVAYYENVCSAATGHNISVHKNSPRQYIIDLLQSAAIYWHAAGFGVAQSTPEEMEHFGMAVAEAMLSGCVPVVHRSGGVPEILGAELQHHTFSDLEGLVSITGELITLYKANPSQFLRLVESCSALGATFSLASHSAQVDALLQEHRNREFLGCAAVTPANLQAE